MLQALQEAEAAAARGEVPVGAVLVSVSGEVLARSGNAVEALADPTAHAEVLVLRAAARRQGTPRLAPCVLYVTLEPCAMCAAAISLARVTRVVFGAYDPKGGAVEHGPRFFTQPTCLHAPEVIGGVEERRASALLKAFFDPKRGPSLERAGWSPKKSQRHKGPLAENACLPVTSGVPGGPSSSVGRASDL